MTIRYPEDGKWTKALATKGAPLLLCALVLTACGQSAAQKEAAAKASASASAAAHQKVVAAANKAAQVACGEATKDFQAALQNIDGRLNVGMAFSDYGQAVGSASVALNAILGPKIGKMTDSCTTKVFKHLGNAYDDYDAAYNTWNTCMQNIGSGCTIDKGSSTLNAMQAKWSAASVQLLDAQAGMLAVTAH